jgi:hypothetical protein
MVTGSIKNRLRLKRIRPHFLAFNLKGGLWGWSPGLFGFTGEVAPRKGSFSSRHNLPRCFNFPGSSRPSPKPRPWLRLDENTYCALQTIYDAGFTTGDISELLDVASNSNILRKTWKSVTM